MLHKCAHCVCVLCTSANSIPCGSRYRHIPWRWLSRKSSSRRNLTAQSERQSLQYTEISSSRDCRTKLHEEPRHPRAERAAEGFGATYPVQFQSELLIPGLVAGRPPVRLTNNGVVQLQHSADLICRKQTDQDYPVHSQMKGRGCETHWTAPRSSPGSWSSRCGSGWPCWWTTNASRWGSTQEAAQRQFWGVLGCFPEDPGSPWAWHPTCLKEQEATNSFPQTWRLIHHIHLWECHDRKSWWGGGGRTTKISAAVLWLFMVKTNLSHSSNSFSFPLSFFLIFNNKWW